MPSGCWEPAAGPASTLSSASLSGFDAASPECVLSQGVPNDAIFFFRVVGFSFICFVSLGMGFGVGAVCLSALFEWELYI